MGNRGPDPASSTPEAITGEAREQKRRERELSFFAEIAHALATAEEEEEVLGLILDRLQMLFSCEAAAIVRMVADSSDLMVSAVRPTGPSAAQLIDCSFEREGTHVDRALRESRPVMLRSDGDATLDPLLMALYGDVVPASGVVIPIRGPAGAELGGLIALNTRERVHPADIRFLLALADHAAVALTRVHSATTRSGDSIRLRVIGTVLHGISDGLDEDTLLQRAMDTLLTMLPADRAEVVLRDGGELSLRYVFPGSHADRVIGSRTRSLHLRTVERGEPTVLGRDEPTPTGAEPEPFMVSAPVQARDWVLGSLIVAREARPFDGQEVEILIAVTQHLGFAIELSRLFRRAAVEADRYERVVAERSTALQATREQLARAQWLASLGEVAAGVAHDLNNALNPIVAFAELIKEHRDQPEKIRTYAERILMAAQGGAETVRRIQRFTRHRPGSMPFQPVTVATLVRDAIELVRPSLVERGDSVDITESMDPQLSVSGNPGELRQALLNLISNALDAMSEGGTLRFVARAAGDDVLIAVQDTGTGMAQETRERAIEPFFTTKGAHGTGLGLAEVYGIARRHGGTLELESWPGLGTTVLLRLPTATMRFETMSERSRTRRATDRQLRILLIDDNLLGLEATAASLRAAGHAVVTASNADSALRLFENGHYDVVLSDLGLPDMSGWDLVERLRSQDSAVRIGLITGWAVPENEEEIRRRGVEVVLTKPVDPEQLLEML